MQNECKMKTKCHTRIVVEQRDSCNEWLFAQRVKSWQICSLFHTNNLRVFKSLLAAIIIQTGEQNTAC